MTILGPIPVQQATTSPKISFRLSDEINQISGNPNPQLTFYPDTEVSYQIPRYQIVIKLFAEISRILHSSPLKKIRSSESKRPKTNQRRDLCKRILVVGVLSKLIEPTI